MEKHLKEKIGEVAAMLMEKVKKEGLPPDCDGAEEKEVMLSCLATELAGRLHLPDDDETVDNMVEIFTAVFDYGRYVEDRDRE